MSWSGLVGAIPTMLALATPFFPIAGWNNITCTTDPGIKVSTFG